MVDRLDLPAPGGRDLDPGLRERPDDVGGQVGADAAAEGGGHLVGQLGETARLATARVALAEQFVQHGAVHVGAPGQARRFISAATSMPADSAAVSSRIRPGCAVASWRRCWSAYTSMRSVERHVHGLRLEEGGLGAGFGGALRRVGGDGAVPRSRARAAAAERGSPKRPA